MSVEVMSWVFDRSRSMGPARMVLLVLANHAGMDGRGAYPSVGTMVKKSGYTRNTVRAALRELEADGRVEQTGSVMTKFGPVAEYRLRFDSPADVGDVAVVEDAPTPVRTRPRSVPDPGDGVTPVSSAPRSDDELTRVISRTDPGEELTPNRQGNRQGTDRPPDADSAVPFGAVSSGRSVGWSDRYPHLARARRLAAEVLGRSFAAPAAEHADRLELLVGELPDGALREVLEAQRDNATLKGLGGIAAEIEGAVARRQADEARRSRPRGVYLDDEAVAELQPLLPDAWKLPAEGIAVPAKDVLPLLAAVETHRPDGADVARRLLGLGEAAAA